MMEEKKDELKEEIQVPEKDLETFLLQEEKEDELKLTEDEIQSAMREMEKKIYIGLDIGTNSCGAAVSDGNYMLKRYKGKDMWAVRLFEEAKAKAERRTVRTSRRRLKRRSLRLRLLREIFNEEISKVDPTFFMRLDCSAYDAQDTQLNNLKPYTLFNDNGYTDKDFYKKYPTIFHLRRDCINGEVNDIRAFYLAVHHIIKYRGNFLFENQELESNNTLVATLGQLNEAITLCDIDGVNAFYTEKLRDLEKYLEGGKQGVKRTEEDLSIFLQADKKNKIIVKLISGGTVGLNMLFNKLEYKEAEKNKVCFNNKYEEAENDLRVLLTEVEFDLLCAAKKMYDYIVLARVKKGHPYISHAMIDIYDRHKKDLVDLKKLIHEGYGKQVYYEVFKKGIVQKSEDAESDSEQKEENNAKKLLNYCAYSGMCKIKNKKLSVPKCNAEDFYKYLKKILVKKDLPKELNDIQQEIFDKIEREDLLPKIIHADSGVFPYQINDSELKIILEKRKKFFSFLENIEEGITAEDKILSLLKFRIPYFVGPVNGAHSVEDGGHAWVVRKEKGRVTPWNFEQKVDIYQSADRFIQKMINMCTYIRGETVLPKNSILYCKYNVLNHINKLRVNEINISIDWKKKIFDELYMIEENVTKNKLVNFLKKEGYDNNLKADDLSEMEYSCSMRPYIMLKKLLGEAASIETCEKIILWHTLFSDVKIVEHYIKTEFSNNNAVLSKMGQLKGYKFKDFGRISRKLLEGICPIDYETGRVFPEKSIINLLYETNQNLMEILNNAEYGFNEQLNELNGVKKMKIDYSDVEELYISPAVKRGVWQSVSLVREYTSILGKDPDKIFIEVTRAEQEKKPTKSRRKTLEELYENCKKDVKDYNELMESLNKKTDADLQQERLYLYFRQLGRCAYSNEIIPLGKLADKSYDVDHIIPRSKIKDDSLSNKVLVKSHINRTIKKDLYPLPLSLQNKKNIDFWQLLVDKNLMNKQQFLRLTAQDDAIANEFINRQLTFTSQSAKAVRQLLQEYYPNTKIVNSKAEYVSEFRQKFNLDKCRDINDLHHAVDAYLNIAVGNIYDCKFGNNAMAFYYAKKKNTEIETRRYNLEKIFFWRIKGAWYPKYHLQQAKKVAQKNSMLVTKFSFTNKGAFFDINPVSAKKDLFPLKSDPKNIFYDTKYGGYNSLKNSYFMAVQSLDKKGKPQITLEGIPFIFEKQCKGNVELIRQKCLIDYFKMKDPVIIMPKIKVQSLLRINGTLVYLGGKSLSRIILHNANQCYLNLFWTRYFKLLTKLCKNVEKKIIKIEDLNREEIEVINSSQGNKRSVDKNNNLSLYDLITTQLQKKIYKGVTGFNNVAETLTKKREVFCALNLHNQAKVLIGLSCLLKCNALMADLSPLGESKYCGKLRIAKNITKVKCNIIHQSITGHFVKEVVISKGES